MGRGLRLISVWSKRDRKIGFEILDLKALRSVSRNRRNAGAEHGTAFGFLRATLAHLQEAGINRLLLELVVNFFGTLPFEDHGRQAHRTIPRCEIGNRGMAGKREKVIPFLDPSSVVGKNLPHEHARVPVVDANGDFHFLERENRWIRLLLVSRNKYTRVAKKRRRGQ